MEQTSLFEQPTSEPLASRMRPTKLEDYVGQKHLLGKGKILRNLIENDKISSMIFWGPPGVGKTTLARIIAHHTNCRFVDFSAVTAGIKEIRAVMQEAEENRRLGIRTILFIDEIHRFNKAQQDAFLPFVEKGSIILIGATTENPSFELNGALLSRLRVLVLKQLSEDDLVELLKRALKTDIVFKNIQIEMPEDTLKIIAEFSKGDARTALSTLEIVVTNGNLEDNFIKITKETLLDSITRKSLIYDKNGEEHHQVISAFHESMRNSDVNAALFWLARMLESGEDPIWIARRITVSASVDVGLADTNALNVAVNAFNATKLVGMPECSVFLTEAVIYICLAPKSDSSYLAYGKAKADAIKYDKEPIPLNIMAAYTNLQKEIGYGKGFLNPHKAKEKITAMQCMPDRLVGKEYYTPTEQGVEARMKTRYEAIEQWKKSHNKK
ncbi:replication-associated recombination protein A [Candidatus Stoquefichus sp. SB1]|uniref:replication-associated recombination protein A n=1 Tax=Candidatus Stoquefichus sp. SB1 TaxID=1658109 RepID=UPI00067F4895|nr:replication-associated recombination protein A [Candidatus Stoquefichus sp. SB1]